MSDDKKPRITVTRGKKKERAKTSSREPSASSSLPGPMAVASGLIRSARTLWWAGLGALSVAEEAGTKVFNALVEEGKSWEQAQRERTEETAKQVEALTKEGTRAVEAVEKRVRNEVHGALHRIGVPHRDDIDELRDRIEALADRMDCLSNTIAEETEDEET